MTEAVGHVVEVATFFRQLATHLEHNGFGTGDGRAAGQAKTSTAASPTTDDPAVRQVGVLRSTSPGWSPAAWLPRGSTTPQELKLALSDAAGRLAVLYGGDTR